MDANQDRLPTALIIPLIQIFVVFFLFIALLNSQNDLTVLALVVLSLLIGTKIWCRLGTTKIDHETGLDKRRVFPGETLTLSTRVRNAKMMPVLAQLSVSFANAFQPADSLTGMKKDCSLLWYQEAGFQWQLTALRRGVYPVGRAELSVGDLFGFYSKKLGEGPPLDVIVYPRLIPLKPVTLPRRDFFGIPGSKSPIEDPVYVYGTRDYQSGRPARYIHWKASARFRRLQEKICEPAAQEKILLMVDVTGFLENGAQAEFEKLLEVAASAAVNFDRSGFAVGLVTNGTLQGQGPAILPIGRGARQLPKILETLARLQIRPAAGMIDMLRGGLKLPWGTTGVNLAYESSPSFKKVSAFFQSRRVPLVSVVCRREPMADENQKFQAGNFLTLADICMDIG
jgi:uncharacterized protein (DUF58 family)